MGMSAGGAGVKVNVGVSVGGTGVSVGVLVGVGLGVGVDVPVGVSVGVSVGVDGGVLVGDGLGMSVGGRCVGVGTRESGIGVDVGCAATGLEVCVAPGAAEVGETGKDGGATSPQPATTNNVTNDRLNVRSRCILGYILSPHE